MAAASNPTFIHRLTAKNCLSFGSKGITLPLKSLNVLVGPNGSGKSNLIDIIGFLRSAPSGWREFTRSRGGIGEWIWKGQPEAAASIECSLNNPDGLKLKHAVTFRAVNGRFELNDEQIEEGPPNLPGTKPEDYFFYRYQNGEPIINAMEFGIRSLQPDAVSSGRSVLAERRDPDIYPELAYMARSYDRIRIYRNWIIGENAILRSPQRADSRNDLLEEDFSNLGLFLSRIKARFPAARMAILEGLKDLYDGISDFDVFTEGGTVQVFFSEGNFNIPAARLSDGTLRYLCLLAILCDPEPPPLICLEEPEIGMHPDIIPKIADLLRSASERTQLIVTTHSDILVDAMTSTPDAVIVCSKEQGQTRMERLKPKNLAVWLEKYRLGELWIRGDLGGTRW